MRIYIIILCLFLSAVADAQPQVQYAQSKEYYVQKRKEIQDEIAETERQLEAIKSDKKATLSQLKVLQNKLALRQNLIANINDEINDIDNAIKNSSKEVVTLKQKLDQLKVRYAQSIRYAYETRSSYDMLAFLFSSRDFNDAMRRMKYLKKFREFRKDQVEQIHQTQNQLQHKIVTLNTQKAQKDERLNSEVQEKQSLVKETDLTNQVMNELKGKESELIRNIEKNRATAKRVSDAINRIIQNEIAKAAKEAEEAEKKKAAELAKAKPTEKQPAKAEAPTAVANNNLPPTIAPRPRTPRGESQPLLSTPTEVALAENFEGNMGKLYWPVDKGFISDHFGVHPHPVEHQVMIKNDGVDIQTSPDAPVKAVFEGTVSSVSYIAGNMMVLIKHGNYFTIYNNLKSATVKKDDHVTARQQIGVAADNDEGVPTVKFQIWKAGKKGAVGINPEPWLGKAR
jgi:murein hydrolase activator